MRPQFLKVSNACIFIFIESMRLPYLPFNVAWFAVGTDLETCFIYIPTRIGVQCSSRDGPPETEEDKKKKQSFLKAIGEAFDEKYMFYFNRRADGYDPRPAPSPASALCERLPNQPDDESDDESDDEEWDDESDEESDRIQPIAEIV